MADLESVQSKKKRVGRGISAGQGKTSGRGTKGQKSRSGHNIPRQHEGGQTPISMRLPKLPGFKSSRPKAMIITLDQISGLYKNGEIVSRETLVSKGLVGNRDKFKILNNGKLSIKVSLESGTPVSKSILSLFIIEKPKEAKPKAEKPKSQITKTKKLNK